MGPVFDPCRVRFISFDCYGTLIDWERGILAGLRRVRALAGEDGPDDATLIAWFSEAERKFERPARSEGRSGHRLYREVLRCVLREIVERAGGAASAEEIESFAGSVGDWPAFADTPTALERLSRHASLVIVSNVDDDLFARTRRHLEPAGPVLSEIITAEQVGSYKPGRAHFEELLRRTGARPDEILHAAESIYHDHEPANAMGLATVWIDRRGERGPGASGCGVTGTAPAVKFGSLAELAEVFDRRGA